MKRAMLVLAAGCATFVVHAADPDYDKTPVKSCDVDQLARQVGELDSTSRKDQSEVCRELVSGLDRQPNVGNVRRLSKVVYVLKMQGYEQSTKAIAHQVVNVVDARGKSDDDAINETFETVVKVYGGTNGMVTPQDLNLNLRAAGPLGKTMSQDGIFTMAAMIKSDKRSRGQ